MPLVVYYVLYSAVTSLSVLSVGFVVLSMRACRTFDSTVDFAASFVLEYVMGRYCEQTIKIMFTHGHVMQVRTVRRRRMDFVGSPPSIARA